MTAQALQQTLGSNVRHLRKAAHMTPAKLAQAIGVDGRELAALEAGHAWPDPETLTSLSEVLEVEPAELLSTHIETSGETRSIQGMPNNITNMLSAVEAAEKLGVSKVLVCRYCNDGRLKADFVGGVWLIDPIALEEFAKIPRRRGPAKKQPQVA